MTDEYVQSIEKQNLSLQRKLEEREQYICDLPYKLLIISRAFGSKKTHVTYSSPCIISGLEMLQQYFRYVRHEGVGVSDDFYWIGWSIQSPHFVAIRELLATPKNTITSGAIYNFTKDFGYVDDWKYNTESKKWEPYLTDNSMIFNIAFTDNVKKCWDDSLDMSYYNPFKDGRQAQSPK